MESYNEQKRKDVSAIIADTRQSLGREGKPMQASQFVFALNSIPGVETITKQGLHYWQNGTQAPTIERALHNFWATPKGTWQHAFWRSILSALIVPCLDAIEESKREQMEAGE